MERAPSHAFSAPNAIAHVPERTSILGASASASGTGQKAICDEPPLKEYYQALFSAFGPQRWWPGKTQFEVIVGAILTQNTSWTNVERAIANLRAARLLTPAAITRAPLNTL